MTTLAPTSTRRLLRALCLALLPCLLLAACIPTRPQRVPMDMISDTSPPTRGPKVLIVFLPGGWEVPVDLVERGFVKAVRDRGIAADVVVVDSHLGYFRARKVLERLYADVLQPAESRGYAGVWLAGISLGGLGSLLYASNGDGVVRPPVAGVMAIAPFLGKQPLVDEVVAAGGLKRWQPAEPIDDDDFSRRLLVWLKGYGDPAAQRPPLYLGYGDRDGFADANAMVGSLLQPGRMFVAPGGHTWAPWQQIWGEMLDRAPLPRIVAPGS